MEFKNIKQLDNCPMENYKEFTRLETLLMNRPIDELRAKLKTLKQVCEEIKELDIELFLEDVVDKKTGKKVEVPKEIRDLWDIYWEHIQEKLLKKFQGEEND